MEQKKMKIEYRKQIDSETAPWQLLTNVDELLWNGVYALRVTADDGSHKLPFRLADDDTVTIVVKDHAHDGMLENGRTVVQTVTRVDRATGNVFVYTRTRYNAGGTHSWSYWTLAGEGSTAVEIPTASTTSLGAVIVGNGLAVDADGKLSLAAASVGKEQLTADIGTQIDSMAEKLRFAGSLTVNDGTLLHIGALVENSTPYSGTNFCAYTDMLLSNGEQLVVNEGYLISAYKVFEGEQEIAFIGNQNLTHFSLDGEHLNYQLEFKKSNTAAFVASELPRVIKNFQRNPIVWSAASHINNFIAPGTYNIHGDRTNLADGLPIYNTGSFSARLTVLAAYNCITQVLTLLNVGGGDSNVYTRTRQGSNWGTWSKLQQNVEVGQTTSLDAYIDNGIYSGVYTNGTTHFETFVMVVINNYSVAAATGTARNITQLKYAVDTNGTFCYHARTGQGADSVEWGEWSSVDEVKNGTVTAEKLSTEVRKKVNNPLRPLYTAAGAEYDEITGLYSLNGVTGLSESDIALSYSFKDVVYRLNISRVLQNIYSIKAFFPHRGTVQSQQVFKNAPLNGTGTFSATSLEIIRVNAATTNLNETNLTNILPCSGDVWSATFLNCSNLREVWPINVTNVPRFATDTFKGTPLLVELRLYGLSNNIEFSDSRVISKASILYIVNNALPTTSAITITLHPDAYARLADDTDIVSALESKPLVSLVSA